VIVQSHPSSVDAWLVVFGPASLLALPAAESARLAELSARLEEVDGFRAVLESLVGDGIAGAPSFALLDGDAAVLRVVLRGEATVTASAAGAELAVTGSGMATWAERVLEGVAKLQLNVPGSTWTVLLGAAPHAETEAEVQEGAGVAQSDPRPGPEAPPAENTLAPTAPPATPAAIVPSKAVVDEPQADPDSEAYDFLFGDTIYRTQAGTSIRIPNPDPERPGDHDGQTMLADDLVLAARATVEHAPSLALAVSLQLERADGTRETLSRPVLIGRSPAASGSGPEPRLIAIPDDPDISRTHLRVAVEGDAVVVTDLGSKNGSVITLPGTPPRKLRASEPTVVLPGTLIDLGGGTTFTVRED